MSLANSVTHVTTQPGALQAGLSSRPDHHHIRKDTRKNGSQLFRYAVALVIVLALSLSSACSSKSEPKRFALLPADTIVVLAFDDPKTLDDPAVRNYATNFREILANVGLTFTVTKDPIVVITADSSGCLFHYDKATSLISSIKGKTENVFGHEVREVPSPFLPTSSPRRIWWVQMSEDVVVFGDNILVGEVIAITEGKAESLFHARTEMQPILFALAGAPRALILFQPSETSKVAEAATGISYLVLQSPEGQLFRTVSSTRALGFSLTHTNEGCEQQISFQFSSYAASTIVYGLSSILPWGPDEIQPVNTHVNSSGKLTQIHANYLLAQCPRIGLGFQRLPIEIPAKTLDSYVGHYLFDKYEMSIVRNDNKLFAESSAGRGELRPMSETEFNIINSTNGSHGRITFIKNGNRILGLKVSSPNGRDEQYNKLR